MTSRPSRRSTPMWETVHATRGIAGAAGRRDRDRILRRSLAISDARCGHRGGSVRRQPGRLGSGDGATDLRRPPRPVCDPGRQGDRPLRSRPARAAQDHARRGPITHLPVGAVRTDGMAGRVLPVQRLADPSSGVHPGAHDVRAGRARPSGNAADRDKDHAARAVSDRRRSLRHCPHRQQAGDLAGRERHRCRPRPAAIRRKGEWLTAPCSVGTTSPR